MKIFFHGFVLAILIPSMIMLNSCEQIAALTSEDEAKEPVEEPEEPIEEEVAEVPADLPEWYDSANPVFVERDTLHIMASGLAPDSSDAKSIAQRAIMEQSKTAWSRIMDNLLSDREQSKINTETEQGRNAYLSALLFDHESDAPDISRSESVWFHEKDETVRCYIMHKYAKPEMTRALKSALE